MHMTHRGRPAFGVVAALAAAITLALALPAAAADEHTITLMTHDSFLLPDEVIDAFETEHGATVRLLSAGDAGSMVNQAILTAERPLADVLFGIDNTFLSRALKADIFEPYSSPALEAVPAELQLDREHRVTPIDYGDVCLNLDRAAFTDGGLPEPAALEDLTDPALVGTLVVENPATSSPGLSFLLATVAHFGEDPETGWQAYWADLRDNDVHVASPIYSAVAPTESSPAPVVPSSVTGPWMSVVTPASPISMLVAVASPIFSAPAD